MVTLQCCSVALLRRRGERYAFARCSSLVCSFAVVHGIVDGQRWVDVADSGAWWCVERGARSVENGAWCVDCAMG